MGHQHHFLSRLDRVSLPHVELALDLYRNPDHLRFLLDHARVPDNAERVAVSLDHPQRGPFLIVTRDGRFVTCLGEGMSPGDRPIVTREKLDGAAQKVSALRARMDACLNHTATTGGMQRLTRRLYEAADELSREDFVALSALQPLCATDFLKDYFALSRDHERARDLLLTQLRRSDNLRPEFRDLLREYWNTAHAMGHLALLASMDGPDVVERLSEPARRAFVKSSFSWPLVRQGILSLAVRGTWGAARLGKPVLATYKRLFADAGSMLTVLDHGLALAALGLRHTRLRAEVQKDIAAGPSIDRATPVGDLVGRYASVLHKMVRHAFDRPEALAEAQRIFGAQLAVACARDLPPGSPYRFERIEDVPDAIAMPFAVNVPWPFLNQARTVVHMLTCLPWIARAAPEDLYLPGDFLRAFHVPWTPEHALPMLRAYRDYYQRPPIPARSQEPARQGPCPCGSGKKYKRCCEPLKHRSAASAPPSAAHA